MKTQKDVSKEEYLNFAAKTPAIGPLPKRPGWIRFPRNLKSPAIALLAISRKSSWSNEGKEEGGASYTRGNAVILPPSEISGGDSTLQKSIHELFHFDPRTPTARMPATRSSDSPVR